jgi:hypothetical protein
MLGQGVRFFTDVELLCRNAGNIFLKQKVKYASQLVTSLVPKWIIIPKLNYLNIRGFVCQKIKRLQVCMLIFFYVRH